MATTSSRPQVPLSDVVWALDRLTRQAGDERLDDTAQRSVAQVSTWLEQVRPLAKRELTGTEVGPVPEFPLTATELGDLQRAVHQARQARRAAGGVPHALVAPFLYPLDHLRASMRHARFSSWLIALGLAALILLNVLDLVILRDLPRQTVFALNVGATVIVAAAWAIHHFHFLSHEARAILQHVAIHHHHSYR